MKVKSLIKIIRQPFRRIRWTTNNFDKDKRVKLVYLPDTDNPIKEFIIDIPIKCNSTNTYVQYNYNELLLTKRLYYDNN